MGILDKSHSDNESGGESIAQQKKKTVKRNLTNKSKYKPVKTVVEAHKRTVWKRKKDGKNIKKKK